MIKTAEQVGAIIKEVRTKAHLTQEQLAAKIQISSQAVSKWEKGESYPDIQQLGSLCDLFGISLDYLMNDSNGKKQKKTSFRVFEIIENENCKIEIMDVIINSDYNIELSILNKTETEMTLKHNYFLLLDTQGKSIEPKKKNIRNYDDNLAATELFHIIPSFVPPTSSVQVSLFYEKVIEEGHLWINIPDFLVGTHYSLLSHSHMPHRLRFQISKFTKQEIVDFYNFYFKKEDFVNEIQDFPKITLDIIDELTFPKNSTFYKDHQALFADEVLEKVAANDEYVDWNFTTRYVKNPLVLREIVKKNYKKIEDDVAVGRGGILKSDSIQDFMDQEIVEFIIKLRAKYIKDYRKWTLEYIDDHNIDKFRAEIKMLKYITNAQLFDSKVSKSVVNQIIRESDISDIHEHQALKMEEFYKDLIEQETMDFLLSHLSIDNIETLTRFKSYMTNNAWLSKKEEYFAKEQEKLDTLKKHI